ncbi:MAG: hypothetical protein ACON4C_03670 [Henriciella sp.]|jgi:hypothetical protein
MLFLLNTTVVDVMVPEARLMSRWRQLGCGDPSDLQAADALDFVEQVMSRHLSTRQILDPDLAMDLAALIITKTGANCMSFAPAQDGGFKARLRDLPSLVLETYRDGSLNAVAEHRQVRRRTAL